ncbi:MAG: ATP-binding protein, partial [Chloroflexota bacterium]
MRQLPERGSVGSIWMSWYGVNAAGGVDAAVAHSLISTTMLAGSAWCVCHRGYPRSTDTGPAGRDVPWGWPKRCTCRAKNVCFRRHLRKHTFRHRTTRHFGGCMDAHDRRQGALTAIDRIIAGELAGDLESQTLDFKEEGGTVDRNGLRVAISPHHEPAARALAEAASCFANSLTGGLLIVGVDDKRSGPAAFVGTHLDVTWLRERIHALTQPHLAVDVIEEMTVVGKRLYLINVAPALEEIRYEGKLHARFGRRCDELSGDLSRQLLESRRRYDWSAEPSGLRLSQALPQAIELAQRYYRQEHGRTPSSVLALAVQLGITLNDEDDPVLNNAGALLLCPFDPGQVQIDVIVTRAEGQPSRDRVERQAPLLTALDDAMATLNATFIPNYTIVGLQRREVRAVPQRAFREALVNAIMHRDYRLINGRVVVTILGDPATILKVRSPGGFPPGVSADRLLNVPSRPRNPVLAHVLHLLGLAEREGIGVDTMYREMLRDGHPSPEIVEDGGDVLCILQGGPAVEAIRSFFDSLDPTDPDLAEDVRVHIAVVQLLHATPLRPEALAAVAQCTRSEALATLDRLERAGALER